MKYKIEYQSAWNRPEYFETNSEVECNEIVLDGHRQQLIVYVNNERVRPTVYKVGVGNQFWDTEKDFNKTLNSFAKNYAKQYGH
jgi:hypothetical protein